MFFSRESLPGKPHIIVGIAEDLTEKKQLEGEVRRLTFSHEGTTFGLTLSQGLTNLQPENTSLDAL